MLRSCVRIWTVYAVVRTRTMYVQKVSEFEDKGSLTLATPDTYNLWPLTAIHSCVWLLCNHFIYICCSLSLPNPYHPLFKNAFTCLTYVSNLIATSNHTHTPTTSSLSILPLSHAYLHLIAFRTQYMCRWNLIFCNLITSILCNIPMHQNETYNDKLQLPIIFNYQPVITWHECKSEQFSLEYWLMNYCKFSHINKKDIWKMMVTLWRDLRR